MALDTKDRFDIIRALYSLNNAVSTMHAVDQSDPESRQWVSDQLQAANQSIARLLERLERELDDEPRG